MISREQIELLKDAMRVLISNLKRALKTILEIIGRLNNLPGYIRLSKKEEIAYYNLISYGKSNNWRRMHGLSLKRRKQLRYITVIGIKNE